MQNAKSELRFFYSISDMYEFFDEHLDDNSDPFQLGNTLIKMSDAFKSMQRKQYEKSFEDWLEQQTEFQYDEYKDVYKPTF